MYNINLGDSAVLEREGGKKVKTRAQPQFVCATLVTSPHHRITKLLIAFTIMPQFQGSLLIIEVSLLRSCVRSVKRLPRITA